MGNPFVGLAGISDNDFAAIGELERAGVTGLTATFGIKYGSVEHDAILVHRDNRGVALALIRIFPEQFLGHDACASWLSASIRTA